MPWEERKTRKSDTGRSWLVGAQGVARKTLTPVKSEKKSKGESRAQTLTCGKKPSSE